MGDLNANVGNLTSDCSIAIAMTMQLMGATYIFHKFPQKKKHQHMRHKHMLDGTHQRSRCDYALVDNAIDVRSIHLVIPPRFQSDHWAVKLQIRSDTLWAHRRYLHNQSTLRHIVPFPDEQGQNLLFTQLMEHHTSTPPTTYPPRDA